MIILFYIRRLSYKSYNSTNFLKSYFQFFQILIQYRQEMSSDSFFQKYGKPFIIGSLSGSVASAVIQPIDTTKVVIQNKREHAGKTKINLNPFHIAKQIIKQNGVAGLYKGIDSAIMRQFIYCGMRLGIYKALEDRVRHHQNRNLSFGQKIQYSLFSGAIGSAIANPTDVALIRFQSDNSLPKQQKRNYKNVMDALTRIGKQQGIRGLWTGAIPTIFRAMAVNSSQLVSYNQAKQYLLKITGQKQETMTIRLTSSALSGISVSVISLPFDNVKTKFMKMKKNKDGVLPYSGFFDCFAKSIKNQGFTGLWAGLPTYYMRIAPHAMITVLLQDFFHDMFTPKKH